MVPRKKDAESAGKKVRYVSKKPKKTEASADQSEGMGVWEELPVTHYSTN